jgi:hypothetical protein
MNLKLSRNFLKIRNISGAYGSSGGAKPLIAKQKQFRLFEMLLLYGGAPLLLTYVLYAWRVPLFFSLQPVLLALVIAMVADRGFSFRRELSCGFNLRTLVWILALFTFVGTAVTLFTMNFLPDLFLSFPRQRYERWVMVMTLYPLLSVVAQELAYRTFFFHRYGMLFEARPHLAIVINAVLFGVGHLMLGNWVGVIGSMSLGALLAWRYMQTQSFWAVWFEHSLYGCLIFTLGLGKYFYSGAALAGLR